MNRVRVLVVLVVAIVAGGGLAYGTYTYLQNIPVKTVSAQTQPVVVADINLSLGAELRSSDLRVIDWLAGGVPDGAFDDTSQVVGRGVIAAMVRHEPILDAKLAPKDAGAGLPPVIPVGLRAVSVRVNEVIGVAGYVLPGTRVDVVATVSPNGRPETTTSKVILANVEVLAAGTRIDQDIDRDDPIQVTVVTLLVTPEQAEKLALASTEGKIQLALRNPADLDTPTTPGMRPDILLAAARPARRTAPKPKPQAEPAPPPPPPTVEVIKGDKREQFIVEG